MARREIVSVAENRPQRLGDYPHRRLSADQIPIDPKTFEPPVQPIRPPSVGVAIRDEGTVLVFERRAHRFDPAAKPFQYTIEVAVLLSFSLRFNRAFLASHRATPAE